MGQLFRRLLAIVAILGTAGFEPAAAQDRDAKVRTDREKIAELGGWIYNDLAAGVRAAKAENKPILVVFRCIPCEACQQFDDDVARRDPIIRDLIERFVCVRIVECNALDLTRFQHDFDQSLAITLMNADGTIYGRFGTRSNRDDESQDISLESLREALQTALDWHTRVDVMRPVLAGKRVEKHRFATPLGYPSLSGKYPAKVPTDDPRPARSCVHCHQVGEAERRFFRDQALPIPEEVLFPYPNPTVLGLHMDPKHQATVKSVDAGSNAAFAGFAPGDRIVAVENEPILSTADIQWILHKQVGPARLKVEVDHDGQRAEHTLVLEAGYRRRGDLSYRATTWDLRRMALGGLLLEALSEAERRRLATSPRGPMALRVAHVGEYGEHAVAKNAGVRKNDIVIGFDGRNDLTRETDVIAYALQQKRPGDLVELRLLRDGETQTVSIKLQ